MKKIFFSILCTMLGPLLIFAAQERETGNQRYEKSKTHITGKLVVDVSLPWTSPSVNMVSSTGLTTTLTQPFHWRLVIIDPENKRHDFPYYDAGNVPHSETIFHIKKGTYTIKLIDDDLANPYYLLLVGVSYNVRIKYQAWNGQFYDVASFFILNPGTSLTSGARSWGKGQAIEYNYTVSEPGLRTPPYASPS
jgi:hypothetical protein